MLDTIAIAHAQCKDEKSLMREFRSDAKKIAAMSNEIPAIFYWYKCFPLEWEIAEIDKFNEIVEDAIAITRELSYLDEAPVNLSISSVFNGEDSEIQKIGFELFLYIKQRFPLQDFLDEGRLSDFLDEISLESKDFLKRKRYEILYLLQYERSFDNWGKNPYVNPSYLVQHMRHREDCILILHEYNPVLHEFVCDLHKEDNKKQISKGNHIAPPPSEISEATLQAIRVINEEIKSGKHTVEDFIQMPSKELFHICDRGEYLESFALMLKGLARKNNHHYWYSDKYWIYLEELLRYDNRQFNHAFRVLEWYKNYKEYKDFKAFIDILRVFAK